MAKGCACLGIVLLVLVVCGVAVAAVLHFVGQPNALRTSLASNTYDLSAGETLTVTLTIENVDVGSETISGIGLGKSLLKGLSIESMTPNYRAIKKHNYPVYGEWDEYTLDQTLFGGDKLEITLTLQAVHPGTYSGDITVWVKSDFYGISMAQARRENLRVKVR